MAVMEFACEARSRVIVLDVNAERLSFVREQFPIEAAIQAGDGSLDQIKAITGGDLPTLVFDATGSLSSMNASFNLPGLVVGWCWSGSVPGI
jgi:threonine dehydrogenase-like Zn-dependent dehydrogenase